jgi:hypothetical protein
MKLSDLKVGDPVVYSWVEDMGQGDHNRTRKTVKKVLGINNQHIIIKDSLYTTRTFDKKTGGEIGSGCFNKIFIASEKEQAEIINTNLKKDCMEKVRCTNFNSLSLKSLEEVCEIIKKDKQ